jgi:uncharacterized RDD family membrane protein YckC
MAYGDPHGTGIAATRVTGRRVVAYLIDALIVVIVYFVLFFALAEQTPNPRDIDCADIQDSIDGYCVNLGDDIYIADDSDALVLTLVTLAIGISMGGILPGLTGATPGKAVTGIRVVRADGRPTGIGRGLLRWLVTIADSFPWCIPMLLGFIVAMTSDTRQRLADKAVGSYVVRSSAAGRPLDLPGGSPGWGGPAQGGWGAPAGQPWGAPPPAQWGAAPPSAPGQWGPPQQPPGQWGPPQQGGWQPPADPSQGGWGSR